MKIGAELQRKAKTVKVIGSTSTLTALVITAASLGSSAINETNVYTDAAVNAGIDAASVATETALDLKADNADVETLRAEVETRLDNIEAKIDALLAALH